jgi:hypothetical protein
MLQEQVPFPKTSKEGSEGGTFMKIDSAPQGAKGGYDSADLRRIEEMTNDILASLVLRHGSPETDVTEDLRLRIAAAFFRFANAGERDQVILKERVLAQFHIPAPVQRRAG